MIGNARRKLNLTQRQMAAALGVDPMTVSRWERLENNIKPAPVIAALAVECLTRRAAEYSTRRAAEVDDGF